MSRNEKNKVAARRPMRAPTHPGARLPRISFRSSGRAAIDRQPDGGVSCDVTMISTTSRAFEVSRKRRRGLSLGDPHRARRPHRARGQGAHRKLGRNDLCPCGSGRRFQTVLPALGPLRRQRTKPLCLRLRRDCECIPGARERRDLVRVPGGSNRLTGQPLSNCSCRPLSLAGDDAQIVRLSPGQPLHVVIAGDDRHLPYACGGDEKAIARIATPEDCGDIARFDRDAEARPNELHARSFQRVAKPARHILAAEVRPAMRLQHRQRRFPSGKWRH